MGSEVLVTFFVTLVFLDVVKVITADDDGALHLRGLDDALEDAATDVDITSEGAFLVNVRSADSFLGGLVTKTDVLPPSDGFVVGPLGESLAGALENPRLLLVSLFDLFITQIADNTVTSDTASTDRSERK